ncbi:MAG: flagellar hook assembly protein FlgD [Desulfobacterales bacterium]|nr:flagellar hook assembly protein FlgD [Desulfobacterales bacterium]
MSVNSVSTYNPSLDKISGGYVEKVAEEDPFGRDAFLTMLVAQLQNQDPLNPMDGTDFTAQLAQFSSLEQMFNINDKLDAINTTLGGGNEENLIDYIGKEIFSSDSVFSVKNGIASGGFLTIDEPAEVTVNVYDSFGNTVAHIYPGTLDAGSHSINWNGRNMSGEQVGDGSYYFDASAANDKGWYVPVDTALAGTVSGVTVNGGKSYLIVDGKLVDPSTVTEVRMPEEDEDA